MKLHVMSTVIIWGIPGLMAEGWDKTEEDRGQSLEVLQFRNAVGDEEIETVAVL